MRSTCEGRLLAHGLAPLLGRRHLVGDAAVGVGAGARVGRADATAGEEQARAAHGAGGLVGAEAEGGVAGIDALRGHGRDAEIERAVQVVENGFAAVVLARVGGPALEADVGVDVGEGGNDGLARQVHARRARVRDHLALPADGGDEAVTHEERRGFDRGTAVAGNQPRALEEHHATEGGQPRRLLGGRRERGGGHGKRT